MTAQMAPESPHGEPRVVAAMFEWFLDPNRGLLALQLDEPALQLCGVKLLDDFERVWGTHAPIVGEAESGVVSVTVRAHLRAVLDG